ncbi:MAG: hypothetical protein RLY21_180 [Planctomycetota bacterium]|jgi:hypothetical protein
MRLSQNIMHLASTVVAVAAMPSLAAASWSASADFSATSNFNGPWSYGTRASASGTSLLLLSDTLGAGSLLGWRDIANSSAGTPAIYRNFSASTIVSGTVTVPSLMLVMHPGPVGFGPGGVREFVVTRWTAPVSGAFDISGQFVALDSGATDVHVVRNGVSLFSSIRASSSSTAFALNSVVIDAGDTIDFVVGNNGSYFHDSTGLIANIVPTPAAAAPLAMSLLVMRRRR